MCYPNAIKKMRVAVENNFPGSKPKRNPQNIPSHCLWMMEEIEKFDESQSLKAARWIGWILGSLESITIITNEESRNMIRIDVESGYE